VLTRLASLGLALIVLLEWPGVALASKEIPGTVLRLSLNPDDPFFIDGEGVSVVVQVTAASTISGDLGLGVMVPAELSSGVCPRRAIGCWSSSMWAPVSLCSACRRRRRASSSFPASRSRPAPTSARSFRP
jgi:hypothetical protein